MFWADPVRQQLKGTPQRSTDGLSSGLTVQLKYSFLDQSLKWKFKVENKISDSSNKFREHLFKVVLIKVFSNFSLPERYWKTTIF
jgi:hypothetical protein